MDVAIPKYANLYDGYLLMKFTSSLKFQQDFLDGKLFFNELSYFANCEKIGQGDPKEGYSLIENISNPSFQSMNIEVINGQPLLIIRDYSKIPEKYTPSTVYNYSAAENRKVKIICFYTLFVNLENCIIQNLSSRLLNEFGNYAILILDRKEFFKRLSNAFKRNPDYNCCTMGFVNYTDLQQGINEWNPFKKEKTLYSYQNEFRIAFKSNISGPITLELGSLRDIAVPLSAESIYKIHFEDGNLLYHI